MSVQIVVQVSLHIAGLRIYYNQARPSLGVSTAHSEPPINHHEDMNEIMSTRLGVLSITGWDDTASKYV
jgi:hypothetical protein